MKVDILIGVAEQGGVENNINMMVPFLQKEKEWEIRVVQMIWEGYDWTNDEIVFCPLLYGKDGHTLEEFVVAYTKFLVDNGTPDVIVATAWPYMCYVGKKTISLLDKKEIPVVSWLHAPVERYEAAGFGGYSYLGLADAHLAISGEIARGIEGYLPCTKILHVKNPVDFERCVMAEKGNEQNQYRNLYFIGRISREKRLDVIIRAMEGLEGSWILHIIGDGEETLKEELRQLAMQCAVAENIHWLGWKAEPWSWVKDADALVLASEYEGFPLVAIEALGNGIPVISTPVSGIVDVIRPGVNGYLYPQGDWNSLNEILRLIAENRFPDIEPLNCKESVKQHRKEDALLEFACKVEALM